MGNLSSNLGRTPHQGSLDLSRSSDDSSFTHNGGSDLSHDRASHDSDLLSHVKFSAFGIALSGEKEEICEALRAVPFFIDLDDQEIERLASYFKLVAVRRVNKVLYSKEQDGCFHIILQGSVQLSTIKDYELGTTIGSARKPVERILCHRSKHAYFGELHLMHRMQQRRKPWTLTKKNRGRWGQRKPDATGSLPLAQGDFFAQQSLQPFSSPPPSYSGHSNPSIAVDLESDICEKLQDVCVKSSEPCLLMRLDRKKYRLEKGSALYTKVQNRIIEFSTFYTCTRIRSIPFFEKIHHGDRIKLEHLASLFTAKIVPTGCIAIDHCRVTTPVKLIFSPTAAVFYRSHVCAEGEKTETFYVIVSGCAVVTVTEQDGNVTELRKLVPGNYCGEVALLNSESRRTATITALDQCLLLCLHRKDFTNFIGVDPSFCDDLLSKARQRIIEKTASKIDLFSGFNKKTLEKLAHVSYLRSVPPMTAIFREGDKDADFFYLIVEGQVDVWQKKSKPASEPMTPNGRRQPSLAFTLSSLWGAAESPMGEAALKINEDSKHLCTLHSSEYFGEIALVSDLPRTATIATSSERCTVLEFNKQDFISIFTHDRISLAELEIRLLKEKTRLCHILLHPVGQQLFHNFLCSEYSQESVDFWKDAERFHSVFTYSNRISTQGQSQGRSGSNNSSSVRSNPSSPTRSGNPNALASILGQNKKHGSPRAGEESPHILRQKSLIATRRANMEQEAVKIYDKYIAESSPSWVNISGIVRKGISEKIQNVNIDEAMYQTAQEEIYELMEKDPFQRFKASDCFVDLLEAVGAYTRGKAIDSSHIELDVGERSLEPLSGSSETKNFQEE